MNEFLIEHGGKVMAVVLLSPFVFGLLGFGWSEWKLHRLRQHPERMGIVEYEELNGRRTEVKPK